MLSVGDGARWAVITLRTGPSHIRISTGTVGARQTHTALGGRR